MTEYADLPEVSALYMERENVSTAITMIDSGGGGVTRMTVATDPDTSVTDTTIPPSVMITVPVPNDTAFLTAVRDWLTTRQADIDAQLATLGVVNPPPPATFSHAA